jgi:hypothetical protein
MVNLDTSIFLIPFKLYGLENDLKMTDEQYLLVLTVFFFRFVEPRKNLETMAAYL